MLHVIAVLQTAATASDATRNFALYVADAAAIGAFGFAWRTNARVTRIETILTEPETGIGPRLTGTSKQTHRHASVLEGHSVKLENHERDIERLDREKEPRRTMGPRDVGIPDRRHS